MIDAEVYSKNLKLLKRCNKFYDKAGYFTLAFAIFVNLFTIAYFLVAILSGNILEYLFKTLILTNACLLGGFFGIYTKTTYLALGGLFVGSFGLLIPSNTPADVLNALAVLGCAFLMIPIAITNSKFHFLEQQEGYPNFSVLLTENVKKEDNARIADPYEKNPLYFKSYSNGNMDEVVLSNELMQPKVMEKMIIWILFKATPHKDCAVLP